jgi:hypothetical protein
MCVYPDARLSPLSRQAERDACELVELVERLAASGELEHFHMAHADLALTLLRLAKTNYPLPARTAAFLATMVARPSLRAYIEHVRPPHPPPDAYASG